MPTFEDFSSTLANFSGTARIFPLPNLVMFPHVLQPLHVFEPRYRDLVEEALAGDQLLALATLRPGWEDNYEGRPPLYPAACLGRIASHCRLKQGSYNVLLLGVQRVRLVEELAPAKRFREARVELRHDIYPTAKALELPLLQERLRSALVELLPRLPAAEEQIDQLLASDVPLGVLSDIVSYLLDISLRAKQRLLGEANVHRRTQLLLKHLAAAAQCAPSQDGQGSSPILFPPEFSPN